MKKRTTTILFSLIAPVAGILFFAMPADAQAACAVSSFAFRTTFPGGAMSDDFFVDGNPPFVYFDFNTSSCNGQVIEVSLYNTDDVNADVDALDNYEVTVGPSTDGQPNFTLVTRAGEENCTQAYSPDCKYGLKVYINGDTIYEYPGLLQYDCDGGCFDADWQVLDIIPLGNVLSLDPNAGNGSTDGNVVVPPTPQQPDNPNGESIINLNLVNPIAGTVDTIPEFFQKVVDLVIKIGIPIIAMAIIYSGFLFVSARGDEDQISTAKNVLWYAILGGLLLFASWLVAEAIKDALLSI